MGQLESMDSVHGMMRGLYVAGYFKDYSEWVNSRVKGFNEKAAWLVKK